MTVVFEQTAPATEKEQLGFAVFLALAVHVLIIFGIGFSIVLSEAPPPTLEVTLAQHQSKSAPEDADYLAQADQQGSGQEAEKSEITTDFLAALPAPDIRDNISTPALQAAQQKQAATTVVSTIAENEDTTATDDNSDNPEAEQEEQIQELLPQELASLQAKLDRQRRAFSKLPTVTRITAASTKSAPAAAYLRYWIDQIEHTGNLNYPEEARRRKLFGNLQLAVTIARNGSIVNIDILQSSGKPVLDQAASRIVRLASPFDSLPAEIKTDHLEIIRTWKFIPGNQLQTGVSE